jgi:DNA-binding MarR family transcriptional regulator
MITEETQNKDIFTKCVQNIRNWEDSFLPLSQSRIAFDLFILIAHSNETEKPLTLKELCNSLKYSERGIRYVLKQLIDGGWCEVVGHSKDKRFRLIVATELLRSRLRDYERLVSSVYASRLPTVNV